MADSIALPQTHPVTLPGRFFSLLPGVLLLAAVGFAGKFIEQFIARYGKSHHLTLPNIEYVLWAILIGVAISNTIGIPRLCFAQESTTYEFWLKAGIVLLGARFLIGDVLRLGGLSLTLVFVEIAFSLVFMTTWGGRLSCAQSSSRFWRWAPPFAESRRLSRAKGRSTRTRRTPHMQSQRSSLSELFRCFCFH